MAKDKKPMTIEVDADFYNRIEADADADGRSVSDFVGRILREKILGGPQRKTRSREDTQAAAEAEEAIKRAAKRRDAP